jgi:hypothetical protein
MDSRRLRCQAISLFAAYAVAVQALLASLVPLAPAWSQANLAVLCSHNGTGGSDQPRQHDLPCAAICAALGHGIAGPLPPDIVVAVTTPQAPVALNPVDDWVAPHSAIRGPQAARAPPLA